MNKVIVTNDKYRIIEIEIFDHDLDELKGDCFKPEANPELDSDELKKQELQFENTVELEGVYGYELQIWDSTIDRGWTHIDSCFGFIGSYNEATNKHYIVGELYDQLIASK